MYETKEQETERVSRWRVARATYVRSSVGWLLAAYVVACAAILVENVDSWLIVLLFEIAGALAGAGCFAAVLAIRAHDQVKYPAVNKDQPPDWAR
jgi:hypothetical protein